MANHLPDNLESSVQQPELLMPKSTSLRGRLDETLDIFNELRDRYSHYSDFLPEHVATKQVKLARELNDEMNKRHLFVQGERIEVGGQTSTIRPTSNSDFYAISKNLAHRAFFEGRFVAARVVPIPNGDDYKAMGNTKYEYAEWTSNRYGLTFMFDQMVVVIPSDDYPLSPDTVEVFPRPYTFIPVEYPGIDLRSIDMAREEVMELFVGRDREAWTPLEDQVSFE